MLPETLCTSLTSAHLCIHREHDDSQRDLGNFARLANSRGPSQKGDSVCMLTLPFSKALTKAPSRGKEHAAHVVMTKVDIADTLVPALEPEPEAVVEDCPDVRDIALNRLRVESSPWSECAEDKRLSFGVRDLLRLRKDGIGLPDSPLSLIPYGWDI